MERLVLPIAMKSAKKCSGFALLFLFASAFACGGGSDNLPPPPPPPPPPPAPPQVAPPPPPIEDAGPPAPAAPPVTLQEGAASPDPTGPLPSVKLLAPTKGQVVAAKDAPDFAVKLDVKNWQTATGSSHVHLILDNKPYKPIYDPKKPIKLSELTGGDALDEGQHILVAFPSRANHESVKTKDALAITEFFVGKKTPAGVDLKKPMLIYSRPKGEYKGDMANHVLVDFQLANDTLAEGKDHVHVTVTGPGIAGEKGELSGHVEKFGTPLYLDNLQNGTYTIKLELVGADNAALPGTWNSTTRKISIDRDAQPEPMPAMAPAGATTGAPAAAPAGAPDATKPAPATKGEKPAPAPKGDTKPKK